MGEEVLLNNKEVELGEVVTSLESRDLEEETTEDIPTILLISSKDDWILSISVFACEMVDSDSAISILA